MISSLRGEVEEIAGHTVTLQVQGVGYEVFCSSQCLEALELGKPAHITIYTDVNQDSIRLFGFANQVEKQTFLLLTKVKGVGPRSAADIISRIDCRDLLRIISAGDVDRLQAVKGIGRKTSERIVVELRDKVGEFVLERHLPLVRQVTKEQLPYEEAVEALQALGFIRKDAERAVSTALQHGVANPVDPGHIVKEALRFV